MQELFFGVGFILVLFVGVLLIKMEGWNSLAASRTVSEEEINEIMQKKPEDRCLSDSIALKIFEIQSTKKG